MTIERISVGAIERELRALWAREELGGPSATRACTFNLIVIAETARRAEQVTDILATLTNASPHRALVVTIDETAGAAANLTAWVQAHCALVAPGTPQVCGEQISIQASGEALRQVPSLLRSLLLPDLPTVLWLATPHGFAHPLYEPLRDGLDRVVVDTLGLTDEHQGLAALATEATYGAQGRHRFSVGDLNWNRLTQWRELIAQFFDTRPLLHHLRRIDEVEIIFRPCPQVPARSLLLAGWLGASLGWQIERNVAGELGWRRPALTERNGESRWVALHLRAEARGPELDPGSITAVHLRATDFTRATFSVERTAEPHLARTLTRIDHTTAVERLAHLELLSEGELLAAELRVVSRDRIFEAALHAAATLSAS